MVDPGLLILNLLFPGQNWQQVVKQQGLAAANALGRSLLHAKLFDAKAGGKSKVQQIAAKMEKEHWTWDSTDPRVTKVPDQGLGRGFVISRDALYRLIKALGAKGGLIVDSVRDLDDNPIYAAIQAQMPVGTSLDAIVALTAEELIAKLLGHA